MNNNQRSAYLRDASGNIMAEYTFRNGTWTHTAQHLYGAERLGVHKQPTPLPTQGHVYAYLGVKNYELTNHLGNVMAVVTDRSFLHVSSAFATAEMVTATDYFPFGMEMPGRVFAGSGYDFGFNTQMESPEILPGHTTAQFWEYDSRIGRRWELDPVVSPNISGYSANFNNPIANEDKDGDWPIPLITAAVGAVVGGGLEIYGQMKSGKSVKDLDWGRVGRSTATGGALGFVAGVTMGISLVAQAGVAGTANVIAGVVNDRFDGEKTTLKSAAKDFAWGAGAGLVGAGLGRGIAYFRGAKVTPGTIVSDAGETVLQGSENQVAVRVTTSEGVEAGGSVIQLNPPIKITEKGLSHVMDRHTVKGITKWAKKSKFFNSSEVEDLIKQGTQVPIIKQGKGNFSRVVDAGRDIGIDRSTGNPTSIYTIITNEQGSLITAFPGI